MLRPNQLKRALKQGKPCLGIWLSFGHPTTNEAIAAAGYDFLMHDNEHSVTSLETTLSALRAAEAFPLTSVVRAPWNDAVYLKRLLDMGAQSVMVPCVETADQAKAAVAACRYPPRGIRGSGPWRELGRGTDLAAYFKRAHEETLICCQIESERGVANAAAIAAVDGVDVCYIGPNDLSGSLGYFQDYAQPSVRRAIDRTLAAILKAGKAAGIVAHGNRGVADLFKAGFTMIADQTDLMLLHNAAKAHVAGVRAALAGGKGKARGARRG